jgi:hypothetical protein
VGGHGRAGGGLKSEEEVVGAGLKTRPYRLVLRNVEPAKEDLGSDPAFVKLAPRIYWLQY